MYIKEVSQKTHGVAAEFMVCYKRRLLGGIVG